jgi:ATP-dependent Clp protease ATP-binding subunit ClpB
MTSNLGSQHLLEPSMIGGGVVDLAEREAARIRTRERVMEAVRAHFRPELLNRIDEIVIFNPLGKEQIKAIVDIQLTGLRARLAERKIQMELTDAARELLALEGFDPVYGARPLKRAIQQHIVQPLAMRLLRGEFEDGDTIVVDVRDGELDFSKGEARVPAMAGA